MRDQPVSRKSHQWVATYPELGTRTNLLEFMESNDSYAAVVMQCFTTIIEGPCYLRGYKLGNWCLDMVLSHNLKRISDARDRCCKGLPDEQVNSIYNESVGAIKNAWKNAALTMGRHGKIVFNDFDYRREPKVVAPRRNDDTTKMLRKFPHCVYCNCELTPHNFTVDHVIPLCKGGGRDGCMNRMLCCGRCNNRKGNEIWEPIHVTDAIRSLPEFQAMLFRVAELRRDRSSLKGGL